MATIKKPVSRTASKTTVLRKEPPRPVLQKSVPQPMERPTMRSMGESVVKTKHAVLTTMTALITAAFGLIAALAWNEAIQKVMFLYFPSGDDISAKVWYAVIVTLIGVIVTLWLGKMKEK